MELAVRNCGWFDNAICGQGKQAELDDICNMHGHKRDEAAKAFCRGCPAHIGCAADAIATDAEFTVRASQWLGAAGGRSDKAKRTQEVLLEIAATPPEHLSELLAELAA